MNTRAFLEEDIKNLKKERSSLIVRLKWVEEQIKADEERLRC